MDSESEPDEVKRTDDLTSASPKPGGDAPNKKEHWLGRVSRREFAFGMAGLTTGLVLYGAYDNFRDRPIDIPPGPPEGSASPEPNRTPADQVIRLAATPALGWVEPEVRKSDPVKKVLRTQLVVNFADLEIDGIPVKLRCYEGKLTGPTLRARAGDTLYITLINKLPNVSDSGNPVCHEPHVTNLHTHGLHVDPTDGDDVLKNKIGPGETKTLRYVIPDDHHPGTFWYHPHKHGAVALQVANGLAGALIIEGDIDQVPEIAAATERIFVFQQVPYNNNNPRTVECGDIRSTKFERVTTVNGVAKPRLEMRPGEVQRWRFIHAGIKEKLKIQLDKHQLYIIAHDGITTGHLAPVDSVELNPGYRVDVLVKAKKLDDPTKPEICNLQDLLSAGVESSPTDASAGLLEEKEPPQYLTEVVIMGEATDMKLPDESVLAALFPLKDLSQEQKRRTVTMEFNLKTANEFQICYPKDKLDCVKSNCAAFDDRTIVVKLDTVDEWVIGTCNPFSTPHHPFHIHVNPFQIRSIGGVAPDPKKGEKVWGDTLLIEKGKTAPLPVVLLTKYTKFVGETVLHCHILDHEDLGMMIKVKIEK